MPDSPTRAPRIMVRNSPFGLTSPRDVDERVKAGRAPVSMTIEMPVGVKGTKIVVVPLDRADLVALIVAAGGALAVLDSQRIDTL